MAAGSVGVELGLRGQPVEEHGPAVGQALAGDFKQGIVVTLGLVGGPIADGHKVTVEEGSGSVSNEY